ncbi:MAG: ogr/Delta-like zinc finger family protein [Bacillota bacterium]
MAKPKGLELRGGKSLLDCPHCEANAIVRSSRMITPLYKHCNMQCTNFECGHTFAVAVEFLHTISPSACARAELHLPTAPPRRRAANDDHLQTGGALPARGVEVPPIAANDDGSLSEAVNL